MKRFRMEWRWPHLHRLGYSAAYGPDYLVCKSSRCDYWQVSDAYVRVNGRMEKEE